VPRRASRRDLDSVQNPFAHLGSTTTQNPFADLRRSRWSDRSMGQRERYLRQLRRESVVLRHRRTKRRNASDDEEERFVPHKIRACAIDDPMDIG